MMKGFYFKVFRLNLIGLYDVEFEVKILLLFTLEVLNFDSKYDLWDLIRVLNVILSSSLEYEILYIVIDVGILFILSLDVGILLFFVLGVIEE